MVIELVIAILTGIIAGTITGLTPGIHINLVAALVLASALVLAKFSPITIGVFIVAMSITHTFLDFVPSVFLGAPTEDTAMSVLPAHRMLLLGHGYAAIMLSAIGSLFGLLLMVALAPLLIISIPLVQEFLKDYIAFILIAVVLLGIWRENNKFIAIGVVALCGMLGYLIFNIPVRDVLFPLFSGLFGLSGLIISLRADSTIPNQKFVFPKVFSSDKFVFLRSSFASSLAGMLPGLGTAQATMIAAAGKKLSPREYILITSATNTMVMVVSFVTWFAISKARNGSIVALTRLVSSPSLEVIMLFLAVSLVAGSVCVLVLPFLVKYFLLFIQKFKYRSITLCVMSAILFLVILLSGWVGLIICVVATSIGIVGALSLNQKSLMMSCLMIPIILFLW